MHEIRLAIVEDSKRYAEQIRKYLRTNRQIVQIDLFGTITEFRRVSDISVYDIVLLDINLPDGSGIDLIQFIKNSSPDTEIIILTTYTDEDKLFLALRFGASGYITKNNSARYIEDGISEVLSGGAVISPDMAGRFLNYFSSGKREIKTEEQSVELTREEIEVIGILARGLTNREISEALRLKYRSVKTVLSKIYRKFGTSSRSEVVRRAVEMGIISI